jgi:uncharacterized protein YaaR (DUF327 family)
MEFWKKLVKNNQFDQVFPFRPSEKAKERVADLLHREKTTGLDLEETAELEHLMRLAKARARQYLGN